MPIKINSKLCTGCGNSKTASCVRVCPGNLLYQIKPTQVAVRNKQDCWDCAACVKECPQAAIELYLPGEQGSQVSLTASREENIIVWQLHKGRKRVDKIKLKYKQK